MNGYLRKQMLIYYTTVLASRKLKVEMILVDQRSSNTLLVHQQLEENRYNGYCYQQER